MPGAGQECSTVEKGVYHAANGPAARRCARRDWRRLPAGQSLTLDGQAITQPRPVASLVLRFRLPRHNVLYPKRHRGLAAAYGTGVILAPLTPGTHTVATSVAYARHKPTRSAFRITVRSP